MERGYEQPPPARVSRDALASRVYQICVERGYVDSHDWTEALAQLLAEAELRLEVRSRPAALAAAPR
ncbi:MAG: hypothetical protein U1B78_03665 [Dehalococcoidia bacterium]|nr:hypothetical protein [Dehalococcoidia bacterium]